MMNPTLLQARVMLEAGRLAEAEGLYRRVLEAEPQNTTAWHELGVAALRGGRFAAAAECLQRAVQLDGGSGEFHNHLAVALAAQQQFEAAVRHFRRAVELAPRLPDAHYNLAKALAAQRQWDEAVVHYRTALQIEPHAAEMHFNLANALRELKRPAEAAASYREALRCQPGYVKAHNNLGNLLREAGRWPEAVVHLREAVRLKPDYAEGHHNLGAALAADGKSAEAATAFRRALELKADLAGARNGLAKVLLDQGQLDEAVTLLQSVAGGGQLDLSAQLKLGEKLRQAGRVDEAIEWARKVLSVKADLAGAHHNLGQALLAKQDLEGAVASYRRALQIRPDFAEAHNNLAVALHTLGRFEEGLTAIETALRFRPNLSVAHLNRAVSWLRMGELARGWHEFEWRRLGREPRPARLAAPLWDGAPLPAGTLLLTAEQGLGDTLHMIRYAPLVKQRCARVWVQCQQTLLPLLTGCADVERWLTKDDPLPPIDAHLPLMSLPLVFATTLDNIPAEVPYIHPDGRLLEVWRERLEVHGDQATDGRAVPVDVAEKPVPARSSAARLDVGIAWQGNKKYAGDPWRSIPLRQFAPLAEVPGVRLFSLQKGEGSEQVGDLPEALRPIEFGPELDAGGAFTDTAAIMQNLDLIITSDTAIPHLAGALGRPVWMALNLACDWRWLDGREDCPWYPTMRLFRQQRLNEWEPVFARIAEELRAVVAGDATRLFPLSPRPVGKAVSVSVAAGELCDKVSILRIKQQRIADPARRANVERELGQLSAVFADCLPDGEGLRSLLAELTVINGRLWEIEDEIRDCDARGDFGPRFIELARSVYQTNDRRAAVKRRIDELLGSPLTEEKQYAAYDREHSPHGA